LHYADFVSNKSSLGSRFCKRLKGKLNAVQVGYSIQYAGDENDTN